MANIIAGLAVAVAIIGGLLSYAWDIQERLSSVETIVDTDSMKAEIATQQEGALQSLDNQKKEALTAIEKRLEQLKAFPLYGQNFCVLQAGGGCPPGFSSGQICIDSEDERNQDSTSGAVGDSGWGGRCGKSSRQLLLCCKTA